MNLELKLEHYEGPLDLLLHLIEKNKVSITDIPIVKITDQYLEYINAISVGKMEIMSEFIEMAATLLAIKAKMLLPKPKIESEEEVDPRQELMEQLLEYKKYKIISERLREYSESAAKNVFKEPSIPVEVLNYVEPVNPEEILAKLDFDKLYQVFQMVMKRKADKIDPIRSQFSEIPREVVSLEDKMQSILALKSRRHLSFLELLSEQSSKPAMVVTFLAILELMKTGEIRVEQSNLFEDIRITFN
ncbi:segregation/condensation protein A [Clostridiales bacterium COT073_COT-073]|nr:segregation/condensation protein A [Clostridiales bacterium COT073_COT-073]